jgi:predicted O-linked N-acetylglucosamine transferase (SPINDLY family)
MEEVKQLLARAGELHRTGALAEAEALYLQVLQAKPDQFEAGHLLGMLRLQQGRLAEALAPVEAALKARPGAAGTLMLHATILHALKRPEEALQSLVKAALVRPDHADAHYLRGNILAELGRYEHAVRSYDKAIAVDPNLTEALDNRGNALALLGRREEALASYDRALAVNPNYPGGWYNRGNILFELGRPQEALASYDRVLALAPQHAGALNGRGVALHALRRFEEALATYQATLKLDPGNPSLLYNHGGAAQQLGRHEEALASFERALALKPDDPDALYARASSLHAVNRWRESIACFKQVLACRPDDARAKFAACMAELPILCADEVELAERHAAYAAALKSLAAEVDRMASPGRLAEAAALRQPFFLAYQGQNDRELQAVYGGLVCRIMADRYGRAALPPPPAAQERVRVGIVTGYYRRHAIWRIPTSGWLSQLDRRRFRLFGYHTDGETDAVTARASALCERFVQGPLPIERWRAEIAADAPHVLIYPEIGMHPVAAQLAAQRLAAVQCSSLGHPETSGFPTMDYFLTSDLMEPADGAGHYSETLIRIPNLCVYCDPIDKSPHSLVRRDFGMRPSACVFWCAQSLFKFLPQHDQVFPRIAREAPDCQFAFVEYPHSPRVTELFRARLERAFAAFGLNAQDHCVILPRLDQDRYIAANGLADVFLNSLEWSGFNSALEALTYDLPIVMVKGALMRGRHASALLEMMGVTETIGATIDDYVAIAARLASDPIWRAEVRGKVSTLKQAVYRDRACISALEDFLDRVARGG